MKKLFLMLAIAGSATLISAQQTQQQWGQNQNNGDWQAKRAEMQAKRLDQMKKDLNLTDDQVSKIKALNQQQMGGDRSQMKERMQQRNEKLKEILTPDQYKKWQDNMQKMMQQRRNSQNGGN